MKSANLPKPKFTFSFTLSWKKNNNKTVKPTSLVRRSWKVSTISWKREFIVVVNLDSFSILEIDHSYLFQIKRRGEGGVCVFIACIVILYFGNKIGEITLFCASV